MPNASCMRSRLSGIRIIARVRIVNAIAASSRFTPYTTTDARPKCSSIQLVVNG